MIRFLWPWALGLLALLPLAVWLYRRGRRPPAKTALLMPDLPLLARAGASGSRYRRHLPAILYLAALCLALLAVARPTLPVPEPHPAAGIVLALDTSRSMQTQDIRPSRFEAARAAVRSFVAELPAGTRVGLVTFGSYAHANIVLTDDHESFLQVVDTIPLIRGTAIGEAMLKSLTVLPELEARLELDDDPQSLATIILLSDGNNRSGIHPLRALEQVVEQRVTVHTVGVGTRTASRFGTPDDAFGGGAAFDETTLKTIASESGGRYVFVASADELRNVYRELGRSVAWRWGRDEAGGLGALAAALVLALSLGLGASGRRVL